MQRSEPTGLRAVYVDPQDIHTAAAGVDLPFPTHQVLFHDQTEETDGDRSRQREGWPAGKGGITG